MIHLPMHHNAALWEKRTPQRFQPAVRAVLVCVLMVTPLGMGKEEPSSQSYTILKFSLEKVQFVKGQVKKHCEELLLERGLGENTLAL